MCCFFANAVNVIKEEPKHKQNTSTTELLAKFEKKSNPKMLLLFGGKKRREKATKKKSLKRLDDERRVGEFHKKIRLKEKFFLIVYVCVC